MAYKTIRKDVDKGMTKEKANAVMLALYGSDEYLAKKKGATKTKSKPKTKKK